MGVRVRCLAGRLIAEVEDNVARYQHTDLIGSPRYVTDVLGQSIAVKERVLAPYGSPMTGDYRNGPGFTGHMEDGATGLTYMQARYYDPTAMRFLSPDPVGVDTSTGSNFNRYNYAANNPYRFIDPDGRDACTGSRLDCSGNSASVKSFGNTSDLGPVRNPEVPSATNPDTVSEPEKEKTFLEKVADEIEDTIEEVINRVLPALAGPEGAAAAVALKSLGLAAKGAATLSSEIAATFAGGKYTSTILQAPLTAYRYSGGVSAATGRFLTTGNTAAQISSPAAASIALRLPLGATAETLSTFTIPAGTRVFMGGVEGGASTATQIFIENPSVLIPH